MAKLPPYEALGALDVVSISAMELNRTRSAGDANQTAPSNAFAGPHPPNPYDDAAGVYGQPQIGERDQRGLGYDSGLCLLDATDLGAVSGATAGYSAALPNYGQPQDGGNVEPSALDQQPHLAIWIESRTQPPLASAVPATPAPSDYTDSMSISLSTIPPSYHTHDSYDDLPSYHAMPPSSNYSSTQEPRAPPSAFSANRARVWEQEGARRPSQAVDGGIRSTGAASDSRRVVGDEYDYHISGLDVMVLPDYSENV
ncbi:hypothetical protein BD311DRAFT_673377 [Dichomitus squalens]|uniref:Uncharacterized protein n=1 Tax=Dichomitus squalens TaxID=114155 RepID=A0A4Q9M9J0_9APHY|nr:hypothetical protein BD311DRAFT_673377 [Dichomitus squalens]